MKYDDSAGIEQSEDMKRFLWCVQVPCCGYATDATGRLINEHSHLHRDNHFAAIASDQPSLEVKDYGALTRECYLITCYYPFLSVGPRPRACHTCIR